MSNDLDCICSDSLENLRALANTTNKELKNLHTKHLFSKFSANDFEFLLEDIRKPKFFEKSHLNKLSCHMMKSDVMKKTDAYPEYLAPVIQANAPNVKTKNNVQNKSEELGKSLIKADAGSNIQISKEIKGNKRAKSQNKFTSISSQLNYIDDFLEHKISESQEKNKSQQQPPTQSKLTAHTFPHLIYYKKNTLEENKQQMSSNNASKKIPKFTKHQNLNNNSSLNYSSKLQKCIIPSINISPVNTISILPNKKYRKSKKVRIEKLKPCILTYKPNLQLHQDVSINIPPLAKQIQPNIEIHPKPLKKLGCMNQGFFVFKHSVSDEETGIDNDSQNSEENSDQGTSYTSSCITRNDRVSDLDSSHSQANINMTEIRFLPQQFFERLEERISSVLTRLPSKNLQNSDKPHSISCDENVMGALIPSTVHVSVQTDFGETLAYVDDSKSLSSNIYHSHEDSTSANKKSSVPFTSQGYSSPKVAAYSSQENYSDESFEHSKEDSLMSQKYETKYSGDLKQEEECGNKCVVEENTSHQMGNVEEAQLILSEDSLGESVLFCESSPIDEQAVETGLTSLNKSSEHSSNLPNPPEDDVLSSRLSPEVSESFLQRSLKEVETSHLETNGVSSPSQRELLIFPKMLPESPPAKQKDIESNEEERKSNPVFALSKENQSQALVAPEKHLYSPADKDPTLSSTSFASGSENKSDQSFDEAKIMDSPAKAVAKLESPSLDSSTSGTLVNESASISAGEALLPSIEIGDLTISEGEIEFEASISDIQSGNHIAIKFNTKDLSLLGGSTEHLRILETPRYDSTPQLITQETQTSDNNTQQVALESSPNHKIAVNKNHNVIVATSNDSSTMNNYSAGEVVLGEEALRLSADLSPDEIITLGKENECLRRRLSSFTGRFVLPPRHQYS